MQEQDDGTRERYESAEAIMVSNPDKAIVEFKDILENGWNQESITKYQEFSFYKLANLYRVKKNPTELIKLLANIRPKFSLVPKAKTAKMVRTVVDELGKIPGTEAQQELLCVEYIRWSETEKRNFLRQRIQTRLALLYMKTGKYPEALHLLSELALEVKKLDDKQLLVEIFLTESRTHHALLNVAKAKASLTAARASANSIYVGPQLQAEIDMQGGALNADERDFRTGFSYFFEAFEGYTTLGDEKAVQCLKYMLLMKIMNGLGDEVPSLLNSKNALKVTDVGINAMRDVAKAYKNRSLEDFEGVLKKYKAIITTDPLIERHLNDLQGDLLEQNLLRIVEPYSRVDTAHVAKLIKLPEEVVLGKLSQMILDKKFKGILDQGAGELVVFDELETDDTYAKSLECMQNMGMVVDSLFRRAQKLST